MEKLKINLFEAAAEGNVNSLKKLLQEDPIILDRAIVYSFSDTPIHIAAILGHSDFVKEILSRKPEFAQELNLCQSSPLHLASAKGYIEVVKVLVRTNPLMCLAHDRNGLIPLHLAAIKGRIEVVKELFKEKPEAAQVTVGGEQTILHLCVKYYQIEALKFLVNAIGDKDFTNCVDSDGNTILHLAVADKQVETVNFLVMESGMEVNAKNLGGMTAMDVLIRGRRDVRDEEIEESLNRAGAIGSIENNSIVQINRNITSPGLNLSSNVKKSSKKKMFEQNDDWSEKKLSALMVVASLIATMAFQVGVNPPGGVWQETKTGDSLDEPHEAGESIYASNYPTFYGLFLISNTIGLIASFSIILLLMSGLPLRKRIFVWILMVITWIAITAVTLSYVLSTSILTPYDVFNQKSILLVLASATFIWLGLLVLLLIGHVIRLTLKIPKRRRIYVWILMLIAWIAITAVTFLKSMFALEKEGVDILGLTILVIGLATLTWLGLMLLILIIGHMIKLIIKMMRKLMNCLRPKERIGSSGITSHHSTV